MAEHCQTFSEIRRHTMVQRETPDVEAQPLKWVSKVLRESNEYRDEEKSFIFKIPEFYRLSGKHYTPVEWRFGLHNREKLYTGGSEEIKIFAAAAFGLIGPKWDEFCEYVVDDPVSLLKSYGLPRDHLSNFSDSEVKCVLALDALFLVLLFDYQSLQKFTNHALPSLFSSRRAYPILDLLSVGDLALVENQIPMALLRKVVKRCIDYADGNHDLGEELILDNILKKAMFYAWPLTDILQHTDKMLYSFNDYLNLIYPPGELGKCEHILDCLYNIICGPSGVLKESGRYYHIGDYIHVESATNLNAYGVKIQPVSGTLEKIAFQKGCLYLPVIMVGDKTGSMLRNIALYERLHKSPPACMFQDYLQLMLDLIRGPNDVKLLAKCGVLSRDVESAKEFEEWNSLGEGMIMPAPSEDFRQIKANIVKHCKSKKNVIWAEFNLLFCSRPWYVISVFTVTIVTIATLIQTYTAVIGSNHMRPHFPGH